jgi:dipeptidase D
MVLENLEPKSVWEIFEYVFSVTPRESKKEEKIRAKLKSWIPERAKSLGINLTLSEDEAGNILIKKPASPGMESAPALLLQGHMDMVCETDREEGFDFDNNPIPVRIQDNGEWVDADGTTLGADNAIGVSIAIALLLDTELTNGPLELLITVDEETGLNGAFALDIEKMGIESKLLINVDSGDLGTITIGSAGGGDTTFKRELTLKEPTGNLTFFELTVSGLFGGHSGVDIHKHRANANKLIARMLFSLTLQIDVYLSAWNGGSKHNAITRESTVRFAIPTEKQKATDVLLDEISKDILSYYKSEVKGAEILEPDIEIKWNPVEGAPICSAEVSATILSSINLLHQGPISFSPSIEGLVETSNNVAIIETKDSDMKVQMSTRSSIDSELEEFRKKLASLGHLTGWEVIPKTPYPGWTPEPKSPFASYFRSHYEKFVDDEVKMEAIHAGLECGIIGSKIPGIQMVAIGPTEKDLHTPDEKVLISDVIVVYELLVSVLKDISNLQL